ncbi:hypothetical protein ACOI1C_21110 [Bacillus sp. DJP31]|uniref:hypothetical protein n=1 Tax=Bacillus sp. DJP31 TaxID=3409789 RepID=UPI003BB75B7B
MKAKLNLGAFILSLLAWALFAFISFNSIEALETTRSMLFNICLVLSIVTFILSVIGFKEIKNGLSAFISIGTLVFSLVLAIVCGFVILMGKLLG